MKEVENRTIADESYDRLRHAIVRGSLRPNQRLVEAELARWLNVSRTPVREVLARLNGDRLVDRDRHGWVVREHTCEEVRQIYECRIALEGYATELAAKRRTDEQAHAILEMVAEQGGHIFEDRDRRVDANNLFHDYIVNAARNEMLADMIQRGRLYHFNYQLASRYSEEDLQRSQNQHQSIADAVARGDGEAAMLATRNHLEESLKLALAMISSSRPDAGAPWDT